MGLPGSVPACFAACFAALASTTVPASDAAEPPLAQSMPLPAPGATVAAAAGPEECPPADPLVIRLRSERPDAIAAWIAERLNGEARPDWQGRPADDSHCRCVTDLAVALAPAHPARAGDIREAFADRFPECGVAVTDGLEEVLAAPTTSGPAPQPLDYRSKTPGSGGLGGGCGSRCAEVEPEKGDAGSRTGL